MPFVQPPLELELPVSDMQPISDGHSHRRTSDNGAHSAGRDSPADGGAAPAPDDAPGLHPFVFDAFRAVRLAKAHGKRAAARRILVELHAFEAAIELASSYAEGLAVVEEVQPPLARCMHAWQVPRRRSTLFLCWHCARPKHMLPRVAC